jgi:hypothetical protein
MDAMDLMNATTLPEKQCLGRGWWRTVRAAVGLLVTMLVVGTTPVAWAQAPQLVSVTPANGTTGVAIGADIVFVFDQPMDTSVPLFTSFPGIFVGNFEVTGAGAFVSFEGAWSADGRTLICTPSLPYPGNATIGWTLNPAGSVLPFTNEDGTDALATVSGSFWTGEGGGDEDCDGLPDGWGGYSLSKGAFYNQASAADPIPETPEGFYFGSNINSPEGGSPVTEASVRLPDNSTRDLEEFFGFFIYSATADLESELEAAYPAGSYAVRFTQTGEPQRVINMTMPANNVPVPKIQNFPEAQAIDAAQDFILRWNSFTGATEDDFLSISVSEEEGDVVFEAPDLCLPRELAVTATSVVIPAGTLVDGQTYTATLLFGKVFYASTNAVPEMSGFGSLSRMTTFSMRAGTGGGPADPATLSDFRLLENGNPEFQLSGTPARVYTIERTGDLTPTVQWTVVGAVTLDGAGQATFEDTGVGKSFPLFYRAVAE